MAAGEYVSVSSQSDTERADLARETRELSADPAFEAEELAQIYVSRGLEANLAREVAKQLMAKDALGAHARDELGISAITTARPTQAALASAATFCVGAAAPLLLVTIAPERTCSGGFDRFALFSGSSRCDRRDSRRRRSAQADAASDVLGSIRDGSYRRHRRDLRQGNLTRLLRCNGPDGIQVAQTVGCRTNRGFQCAERGR